LGLVALGVAFFMLTACETDPDPCRKTEISRKTSPDGRLAAFLQSRDCGKFTSIDYQVLITATGQAHPGYGYVFQADQTDGLKLTWLGDRLLEISYRKARIFRFTNIWRWTPDADEDAVVVEVRLTQTSPGSALTPQAQGKGAGQGG
jgi:hypothetical protein